MTACSLDSQNSPVPINGLPIRHWSVNSLRPHKSLIFLPRHGYCDGFFVGIILESFRLWAIWRALRKRDDYVLRGERPRRITPSSISIMIILHKILSLIHYLLILCTSSIQFPQYRNMARLWSFPLNTRCPLNIQSGQLGFQWILLMTPYIFDFSFRLMPLLTFLE